MKQFLLPLLLAFPLSFSVQAAEEETRLDTTVVEEEEQQAAKEAAARMADIRKCATAVGSRLRGNRVCRGSGNITRDEMMNQGAFDSNVIQGASQRGF